MCTLFPSRSFASYRVTAFLIYNNLIYETIFRTYFASGPHHPNSLAVIAANYIFLRTVDPRKFSTSLRIPSLSSLTDRNTSTLHTKLSSSPARTKSSQRILTQIASYRTPFRPKCAVVSWTEVRTNLGDLGPLLNLLYGLKTFGSPICTMAQSRPTEANC